MRFERDMESLNISKPAAISLGKFDGLHSGHRLLTDRLSLARQEGLISIAVTFDLSAAALTGVDSKFLSTQEEKEWIFEQAGIDILLELPFTPALRSMQPEAFLQMLTSRIPVRRIVCGTDFRFGKDRRGDYRTLQAWSAALGYQAEVVEKLQDHGVDISSTRIRQQVEAGNIREANRLLGYAYFASGQVVTGNRLGRTIGVPTANLLPPAGKLLPPNGVYASMTEIDGQSFAGISNIGKKPTVGQDEPYGIETHLFDFDRDIYGKQIRVSLIDFIRPERKFPSLEALKEQMSRDMEAARGILG